MNFVVLSSSHGTTLSAILAALADGSLSANFLGLVTDSAERGCAEKARAAGYPVQVVEKREGESREERDRRLDAAVRTLAYSGATAVATPSASGDVDVIAAIGWMSVLSPEFIARWRGRILNVHPALLPQYGGKGMYGMKVHEAVLAAGDRESGMTIHVMDEGVDTGQILVQKKCSIVEWETPESLKAKVQALEKEWYPKVLERIQRGEIRLGEWKIEN